MQYRGMDDDRVLILASEGELGQYLSSKTVFWRLAGSNLLLTPGNLLLALYRYPHDLSHPVDTAQAEILRIISMRKIPWESKIKQEVLIRINQWKTLIEDYQDQGEIDSAYSYNVRTRVILTLLLKELNYIDQRIITGLDETDRLLQVMMEPGNFVWEQCLVEQFPQDVFSFLYVKL